MASEYAKDCPAGLYDQFIEDRTLLIHKWHNYFWVYERHLQKFSGKPVKMLEIGVQKGGSTKLFKCWLGDAASVVGVDIDESCRGIEFPIGITVEIGDQVDPAFLNYVAETHGPFDIVLDDGGHTFDQITTSFKHLFDHVAADGIYMIEDTCCQFWQNGNFAGPAGHHSFRDFVWDLNVRMNTDMANQSLFDHWHIKPEERKEPLHTQTDRSLKSISLYESILVIEKGERPKPYSELRR